MNIIGPDELVFGVDDPEACTRYLIGCGLKAAATQSRGGRFEALDGTAIVIRPADDPDLPVALGPPPTLRQITYGVGDEATLEAVAAELGKDREIRRGADGSLTCVNSMGFALKFQRTVRRPFTAPAVLTNAPGALPQRPINAGAGRGVNPASGRGPTRSINPAAAVRTTRAIGSAAGVGAGAKGIRLFGTANEEIMTISSIERNGDSLVIKGKALGTLPLVARLDPGQARAAIKLMGLRRLLFLLTLPFRRSRDGRE